MLSFRFTNILKILVLFFMLASALNAASAEQSRLDASKKLRNVIKDIEENYVDELTYDEIINKAIEGLLSNLDAHSAYLSADKYSELQAQTDGEFGGIGITLGMKDGALTVIAPIDNTPAHKVGIKSGDIILKIDNQSTISMSLDDAVKLMRGKPKTKVELAIVRSGEPKPLTFKITRDIIKIESVKVKKVEDTNYAYVRVSSFDRNVTSGVRNGLKALGNVDGVILDLRSNPGGLLDQAVDLSKLFIKNGVIVSQKGRKKGESVEFKAGSSAPYAETPLVVLINGGSASASEIVAGALQDHKRAILVGESSFGKGSVQMIIPQSGKEAMKLTIARYYLPSGRTIQAEGLQPDIQVAPGAVPQGSGSEFAVKEADLKRHLRGELSKMDENIKEQEAEVADEKNITNNAVMEDIQLKTAIDVLKTWAVLKPMARK